MADVIPDPIVDGDDYEPGQKYASYRPLLSAIRSARIREEVKLRRINHLKAEVIPFCELRDRESEELMAVFLKYNGPDGIRKHYSQEYDEIKARIASSGDTCLFEDMGYQNPNPISRSGKRNFSYGRLGTISYNIEHDMENNSAESQSGPAQYDAIVKQGPEPWPDPERILSHPDYYGRKPDDSIETLRQEQFERGQERVRQLRSRLSRQAPSTGHGEAEPPIKGEAQLDGESRKRPRENGSDVATDDGPVIFPSRYRVPSSKRLKFSRNTITMSKIAKMGKKRPWLFGYDTAEGYGIYAFVKCPGPNCKHHFSSHPLKEDRAHDHILGCNQQIRDDRDMVREYARQVIKEDGRISDLTVDWARKSNLHLLSSNLQDNHPDNFPLSLDDDDDDDD
ncbi:hypothetical protein UCDDA912_g04123 [Diaporthe ampelina]|uniref:Uncharacterized protein n=1 Tax=Diaporthe ampelina TaxID=1214573 RepID=A0A0G2FPA4_9PEZI|nr:hypothetical protein UCDDA912_g04123 [Diaporthe ampelina]